MERAQSKDRNYEPDREIRRSTCLATLLSLGTLFPRRPDPTLTCLEVVRGCVSCGMRWEREPEKLRDMRSDLETMARRWLSSQLKLVVGTHSHKRRKDEMPFAWRVFRGNGALLCVAVCCKWPQQENRLTS